MDLTPQAFQQSAAVYDLLYGEKESSNEAAWVSETLKSYGCKNGQLLEFGSGTGRHARLLAERGYFVTGVEPSVEMLQQAKPHPRVTFLQGDTSSAALTEEYDAVLALFHVMSYHTSNLELHSFFRTASRHLKRGGLFGFDVWYSPAVSFLVPERRTLTKEDDQLRVTRKATPSEDVQQSRVAVHYAYTVELLSSGEVTRFEETHSMRHFTTSEIQLLAEIHGFTILDSREFLTGQQASRDTWGVWFTLQKD